MTEDTKDNSTDLDDEQTTDNTESTAADTGEVATTNDTGNGEPPPDQA